MRKALLREVSNLAEEKSTLNEELQSSTETEVSSEGVEEVFAESEAVEEENVETNSEDTRIQELEAKLQEAENRYLRLQADFDNSRRRARIDLEAAQKYRAQSLITNLLPALDNFERALQVEADNDQAKSLLQGMDMVYRSLTEALKSEGLEAIEAVGNAFDPHIHQAVMQVEDPNFDSNIVVEEFQKGYRLKDKVIRPSMVKVNQ
jgi:molecular chaperone GrpE